MPAPGSKASVKRAWKDFTRRVKLPSISREEELKLISAYNNIKIIPPNDNNSSISMGDIQPKIMLNWRE